MDFSFDAVVTAIEQFATPAPELIEGLFEAPQNAVSAYEGYLDAGSQLAKVAGVNLDSAQQSPAAAEAAELTGFDMALSLDASLSPAHSIVTTAESPLHALPSSPRYLHELGAAEVGGSISLSMTPTTEASLSVSPSAWQGESKSSGI
jgi:hypothetical protein